MRRLGFLVSTDGALARKIAKVWRPDVRSRDLMLDLWRRLLVHGFDAKLEAGRSRGELADKWLS